MDRRALTIEEIDAVELPEETAPIFPGSEYYYPFKRVGWDDGKAAPDQLELLPKWCEEAFSKWMYHGLSECVHEDDNLLIIPFTDWQRSGKRIFKPKTGSLKENLQRIAPLMGSFGVSHQQKQATVALYFYKLFDFVDELSEATLED